VVNGNATLDNLSATVCRGGHWFLVDETGYLEETTYLHWSSHSHFFSPPVFSEVFAVRSFFFSVKCFMDLCLSFFSLSLPFHSQIYWWRKPEFQKKANDMPHVTKKMYHIMLYRVHFSRIVEYELTTEVVIDTDYIDRCLFNCNKIAATATHYIFFFPMLY